MGCLRAVLDFSSQPHGRWKKDRFIFCALNWMWQSKFISQHIGHNCYINCVSDWTWFPKPHTHLITCIILFNAYARSQKILIELYMQADLERSEVACKHAYSANSPAFIHESRVFIKHFLHTDIKITEKYQTQSLPSKIIKKRCCSWI